MKKLIVAVIATLCLTAYADPLGYPNQYSRINTNTTLTVKSGVGTLAAITVGVAGTATTVTIYDNTAASGSVIAVLNTAVNTTYTLNTQFNAGLTVVTAGTTPADLSISYK